MHERRRIPTAAATIAIRRATPEDASAIARILRDAFDEFRAQYTPRAYDETTPDAETIAQRLDEGPVWIANLKDQLDGAIIATAGAVETAPGLYIRSMATAPAARGRSVASALLDTIERFARQRGIDTLYLSTTPFLERATALYQRAGFAPGGPGPTDLHATPLVPMIKTIDLG